MASAWQRHLLAVVGDLDNKGGVTLWPEVTLISLAASVILVFLLALCACKESSSQKGGDFDQTPTRRVAAPTSASLADPNALMVEIPGDGEVVPNAMTETPGELAIGNGVAHGGRNGVSPNSHSRQASSGSGQMRPTSLRELPDLPVSNHNRNHSGAGLVEKASQGRSSAESKKGDTHAYDHLGVKAASSKIQSVNYDHINLESPREHSSGTTPASEVDTACEDHYTQVRERTYDVVQDVRVRSSTRGKSSSTRGKSSSTRGKSSSDYDPYAKVKDDEDDREDTYAQVKDGGKKKLDEDDDDGDYAHLKSDHVLHASTSLRTASDNNEDNDEDPYEKVMEDSAGGREGAGREIADQDDPYSVLSDGTCSQRTSAAQHRNTNLRGVGGTASLPALAKRDSADLRMQYTDEESDGGDHYASVVKDRNASTNQADEGDGQDASNAGEEIEPYFVTPPEPPRMYEANEVSGELGAVVSGDASGPDQQPSPSSSRHDSKEHRYTKVTARESLASMTARNALNTYEIVPDLPENTYATVEGGSGDGLVRYTNQSTAVLHHCNSELSETYAEIGASASGGYATPAPEPPSLETLHSMFKSTSTNGDGDHGTTQGNAHLGHGASAGNSNVVISDDGYAVVSKSGFSPSETALPQIPCSGTSGSIGSLGSLGEDFVIKGVTLHSDYHSVKDCIPDQESENDPNYESVDEALSKSPASVSHTSMSTSAVISVHSTTSSSMTGPRMTVITPISPSSRRQQVRNHEYEEVSPSSNRHSTQASRISSSGASNGPSAHEVSLSPALMKPDNAKAAEARDRVLQTHMYEEVSEVKKKGGSKRNSDRDTTPGVHSVNL